MKAVGRLAVATAALLTAAGCGGGSGSSDSPARELFTIDHQRAPNSDAEVAPYNRALDRVAPSCPTTSREGIASMVTVGSEQIEKDTGRYYSTLELLRTVPIEHKGFSCANAFALFFTALEGAG